MSLVPIFPFTTAVIGLILLMVVNILDDKFRAFIFIVVLISTLSFLAYIPFFETLNEISWFSYAFYSHVGATITFLIVMVFVLVKKVLFFKQHYKIFLNSVKASKINAYYVIDHKNRIKEMSDSVLEEIGFEFSEVKGKNIFDIFNKSIRITHFDEIETNNRNLEGFYESYPKTAKPDQLDSHSLMFQNYKGQSVLFITIEQPIFIMGKYVGRINIGEKRSDFSLVGIERKLKEKEKELEELRQRYVATIELTEDGLYYIDLDEKYLWASEKFLEKTHFTNNMIDLRDYQNYIYKEDLNTYLGTMSSLTTKKENFKTRYRLLINGEYVWVTDKGKRIFEDSTTNIIVGALDIIDTRGYAKLGIEVLDNMKTEKDIHIHLKTLYENNRRFQLALFDLKNIPEINKEYGREIGNMLIGEYVKKLKDSFMSDSSEIFRISGLVFAVTIMDPQKMQLLKTGSTKNPKFLNMEMNYGAINTYVDVLLGVSSSYVKAKNAKEIYEQAIYALSLTKHKNYASNVCYFEDLDE